MAFFFYQIRKEINRPILVGYTVFIILILMMYSEIKSFSSPWQHPSYKNLLGLHVVKSNIKWTLDWIFYGGILYPLYKFVPEVIKNNFLSIFAAISGFLTIKFTRFLIRKKLDFINISNLFLLSIVLIWPLSIMATLYFSGMFGGERYSITIMPIVLFYISWLTTASIWKIFPTTRIRAIASFLLIVISLSLLLTEILPVDLKALDTPDHQFVKQNVSILKNEDAYLILDNGVYSAAFFPLASIYRIPIKVNYFQCRDGQFQITGRNTMNDWLEEHKESKIYLYSLRSHFMEPENILWQNDGFVLYRLTHVPEAELCQSPNSVGECYIKCIRGETISPDGRSIKGVAPNLGVYRP